MSLKIIKLENLFTIAVPETWHDMRAMLHESDMPITIGDPTHGVGVMQFTVATYESGKKVQINCDDLKSLLEDFSQKKGLGDPLEMKSHKNGILTSGATYRSNDELLSVWYVSDGVNIIFATYVCGWNVRNVESEIADVAVRSIRFE